MEMDLDLVRRVIEILEESQVDELEVESGEFRVRVKKSASSSGTFVAAHGSPLPIAAPGGAPVAAAAGEEAGVQLIRSPMVGTFYRASSPDSPVFVQVGDNVEEGSVVCILEAMKVMNEIKAEVTGTVIDILVDNGRPVEFGQPLFKVRAG